MAPERPTNSQPRENWPIHDEGDVLGLGADGVIQQFAVSDVTEREFKRSRITTDELIGSIVGDMRASLALTQSDIARAMTCAGVKWSRETVSTVEDGARTVEPAELAALAAYFGLPVSWLAGGPGSSTISLGHSELSQDMWAALWGFSEQLEPNRLEQIQRAGDDLFSGVPRPWVKKWRAREHMGSDTAEEILSVFAEVREETLSQRPPNSYPGPIWVLANKGFGGGQIEGRIGLATVRIYLKEGEPHTARDETEALILAWLQHKGQVKEVTRNQAYYLRQKLRREKQYPERHPARRGT